jgi:hypothetical protein
MCREMPQQPQIVRDECSALYLACDVRYTKLAKRVSVGMFEEQSFRCIGDAVRRRSPTPCRLDKTEVYKTEPEVDRECSAKMHPALKMKRSS